MDIARRHGCTIAQVAISAVVSSGNVDAAIVGISPTNHPRQNRELARPIELTQEELTELWSWQCPLEGGFYELERTSRRHASIMKYNLNRGDEPGAIVESRS